MATYKATIFARQLDLLGDTDFTFNCHVNGTTTLNAWERANEVAESLAGTVWSTGITGYAVSVSNPDVVNGSLKKSVSLPGTREVTGAVLPAWNCTEVQFSIAEGVRSHTFYPRIGLTEDDVTGQVLSSAVNDALDDFIAAFLLTGANCDKDGSPFAVGSHSPYVKMRQMGWRRRSRPGYKRGWVPV